MKKIIALALAACLLTSFAGCGKSPNSTQSTTSSKNADTAPSKMPIDNTGKIVETPITLTGFVYEHSQFNADYDQMPFWDELSKETNINFEFERIPSAAWIEKLNLKLISGSLPDFFGGNYNCVTPDDIAKYGGKAFYDFSSLLGENAPNLMAILEKRPDYASYMKTVDGKMYGFPAFFTELEQNIGSFPLINQRWLEALKLPMPKTTDELYTTLKAFKENDPNGNGKKDEIPLSAMDKTLGSLLAKTFGGAFSYLYSPADFIASDKDGKIYFSPSTDGYKESLKYLRMLYTEKLIDQEIFTTDRATYVAKANQGRDNQTVGIGYGGIQEQNFIGLDSIDDYIPFIPVKGPTGASGFTNQNAAFMPNTFVITTANKYPAETVRLVDRLYEEKWSFQTFFGMIGTAFEESKDEPGKYVLKPVAEGDNEAQRSYKSSPKSMPYYMPEELIDKLLVPDPINQLNTWENCRAFVPHLIEPANPAVWPMTVDDSKSVAQLRVDLQRLVEEKRAAWVSGSADIDAEWDSYISVLKSMGVDDYVKYYQTSYDGLQK